MIRLIRGLNTIGLVELLDNFTPIHCVNLIEFIYLGILPAQKTLSAFVSLSNPCFAMFGKATQTMDVHCKRCFDLTKAPQP